MNSEIPASGSEISHLLLFYAFLGGLAQDLVTEPAESAPIDRYRRLSRMRREEFILSIPGQSELSIALGLASYLENRTFLLSGPSRESLVRAVIDDPAVAEDLQAVGRALHALPEAAWLSGDIEPSRQALVDWENSADSPALGTREPLGKVMDDLSRGGFLRGEWPQVGGAWWSAPAAQGLPLTTRTLRSFAAVELVCRDDSFGEEQASAWNVSVTAGVRVAEIHSLADWASLVEAYPLEVTGARRVEWSGRYGQAGPWLVPDWSRLARDWDGVHVSAEGYLRAQEQTAPVRDGRTVLRGWNPDATYWLREVISLAESVPERWIRGSGPQARWRKAHV
jgi:hypothetical protein